MTTDFLPVGEQVDITNCEREPIHIPGSIQPHGVLLTTRGFEQPILQVSDNCASVFGVGPEEVLGRPLSDLVDDSSLHQLKAVLSTPAGQQRGGTVRVVLQGPDQLSYDVLVHHTGQVWVIELEAQAEGLDLERALSGVRSAVTALSATPSVPGLLDEAADQFRALTGFDRVMIYRFDQEWNGQVVAETKRPELESFLGLHYPASDIPPQARALYAVNWLRFIRDVDAVNPPLVPAADPTTGQPLDMSMAVLRSVSPIHCEYLRNMRVTASMSISLIVEGNLAGLVACHHYSGPFVPPAGVRATCEFLAQSLSLMLSSREQEEHATRSRDIQRELSTFTHVATEAVGLSSVIDEHAPRLMAMVGAHGMAWTFDGDTHTVGATPAADELAKVRLWGLAQPAVDGPIHTDRLGIEEPTLAHLADTASGVVMLRIADDQDVMFFRPEEVRTVDWAGNPHLKVLEVGSDGESRLSPRGSFALWRETVQQRSADWSSAELAAAEALGTHLMQRLYNRHRTVAMVAETLQRSLLPEHLPAIPGWSMAADSRPATAGVGGDWYDVFTLPSGRLLCAVGDVAGHGLGAASAMSQLRNALRAYAIEDDDPMAILTRLDRLTSVLAPDTLATAVVSTLDPTSGELRVATAGHPMPVLWQGGRATLMSLDSRPPLGAGLLGGQDTAASGRVTLGEGHAVLLVSDGMFERRDESIDVSLDALTDRFGTALSSTHDTSAILGALIDLAPSSVNDDDVTLLLLRRD